MTESSDTAVDRDDRRRVAFFATVDWYFAHHYLALAEAVRDAGYAVTVITGVGEQGPRIRAAGLDLVDIAVSRKGMHPWHEARSLAALVGVLRRLRPHLLHNIAQKPVLYGTLAARFASVPAVVDAVAGMGWLFTSNDPRARLARPAVRAAYRALLGADNVRVLVQNPDDGALVAGLTGRAPTLIPGSGVDVTRFTPRPEPSVAPVVLLASRLLWDKGIGEFVAAARLLKAQGSSARFVLVGRPDPDNRASVDAAQLTAWQREGSIEWWGHSTDMPTIMGQAHIACLPSFYREGLPKFLIEAAAAGLPLVTTDATGCREAVDGNGLLVPVRDPAALAEALARLLADPALRARLGARSRQLAETRFAAPRIHAAVLGVYGDLLGGPMGSPGG